MKETGKFLLILILMVTCFTGCKYDSGNQIETDQDKLTVISTIFPGYDFVREVAGDAVNLSMLLPPGAESHSFEPTPQDIIKISQCDVFIYVGGESDTWVDGILDTIDTSDITIISMMELVEALEEEIKEGMQSDEEDDEEESEYDEHVWTSPINAVLITEVITEALCSLDQDNQDLYVKNATDYIEKLMELDAAIRAVVNDAKRDTVIFGDRFPFLYFAKEYGLDYYAAFPGCSSETEANIRTITFLIDKINDEEIPVVFFIEFSSEKLADTICDSTDAKKLLFHSCHNVTKKELDNGVTYISMMMQNVENLKEALS